MALGGLVRGTVWTFLCPCCGEQYRPWMEKPIYVKKNMVWIAPVDAKKPGTGPEGHVILDAEGQMYNVTPMLWADTTAQALQNTFKEVIAEVATTIDNMSAEERLDYVQGLARKARVPRYLKHYSTSGRCRESARDRNTKLRPGEDPFVMDNQGKYGVWAANHQGAWAKGRDPEARVQT